MAGHGRAMPSSAPAGGTRPARVHPRTPGSAPAGPGYRPGLMAIPVEHVGDKRAEFLFADRTEQNFAGSDAAYESAARRLALQTSVVESASVELLDVHRSAEKTAKKLETVQHKKFAKKLFPKTVREKAARYEERLAAAVQMEATVESKMSHARDDLKRLEMEKLDLEAKAATLAAAKDRKHDILEELFNGSYGTDEENQIEDDRNRFAKTLEKAKHMLESHLTALALLKAAAEDLQHAMPLLKTATMADSIDLFSEHGHALITDAGVHHNVKNATKLARTAHQKLVEAADCNPYLPIAKQARAHGGFAKAEDIGFNTAVGEGYVKAEVERAVKRTHRMLDVVTESVHEQIGFVRNAKSEVVRLEKELAHATAKLEAVRAKILREIQP